MRKYMEHIRKIITSMWNPERILFYVNYYALRAGRAVASGVGRNGSFDACLMRMCMPVRNDLFSRPEKVVQVVGIPRSGTTLVGALVGAHPGALSLLEPFLSYLKNGSFKWTDPERGGRISFVPPVRFINRFTEGGRGLLVFKETWRNERQSYFPNSAFIRQNTESSIRTVGVLRDPRAIWRSFMRREGNEYEGPPGEAFIHNWNSYCKWVVGHDLFCIRYEDLMKGPDTEAERLFSYLGLPPLQAPIRLVHAIGHGDARAQSSETFEPRYVDAEEGLAPSISARIVRGCGEWMRRLGYLRS
jgi:hypothetical protein